MNFQQYLEETDGKVAEKWQNLKNLIPYLSEIDNEIEAYARFMVLTNNTGILEIPKEEEKIMKVCGCGKTFYTTIEKDMKVCPDCVLNFPF